MLFNNGERKPVHFFIIKKTIWQEKLDNATFIMQTLLLGNFLDTRELQRDGDIINMEQSFSTWVRVHPYVMRYVIPLVASLVRVPKYVICTRVFPFIFKKTYYGFYNDFFIYFVISGALSWRNFHVNHAPSL